MKEIEVFEEQNEIGGIFIGALVCTTGCGALCVGTAGLGTGVGTGVSSAGGLSAPLP